jgi:drug/metabolite transporter (DMT)-like permease
VTARESTRALARVLPTTSTAATGVRAAVGGRFTAVDATLVLTVVIWSMLITAQKYALAHGVDPLTFAVLRNTLTAAGFSAAALAFERTLKIARRHALLLIVLAGGGIWINQLALTYALHYTTATTVALVLGAVPAFALVFAAGLGLERISGRAVAATVVSLAGVALVVVGSHGSVSADLRGDLLALGTACSWAAFSVALVPLLRHYSALRIGAITFLIGAVPLWATGYRHVQAQTYDFSWLVWGAVVYAGTSLVLANALWFRALRRVGPARATLFGNLQPFIAALFAVVLLSEPLSVLQLVGGVILALGIAVAKRRSSVAIPVEPV